MNATANDKHIQQKECCYPKKG